jgi:hypothetical protein
MKDFTNVSDLNPKVIHIVTDILQWLFFASFIFCFILFFTEQKVLNLVIAVFFLRWSITVYQLKVIYDKSLFYEHQDAVKKEQDFYRSIGRNGRRKLGIKQVK